MFIAFYEGYQNYFISVDNSTGESVRSSSAYRIPIYRTTLFIMVHTTLVMRLFMQYTPTRKQRYRLMANTDYTISCIKTTRKLTKTEYKFSFLRKGQWYEPTDIFLIGNQPYFCEELKYNMESKGCPEVVEGTFSG